MTSALRDALKLDICRRFYIETRSKIQISKDLKCSPTTVKKYIRDNPPESDLVRTLVGSDVTGNTSHLKGYLFKTLQVTIDNAVEAGDPNLKHLGLFEVDWMKRTEKMVKLVSKYAEAAQKHLKMFQDLIKELEIKYNKRSPDFGRVQNLNIQQNKINLSSSVACEMSQDLF